jgi:hypothetical protein
VRLQAHLPLIFEIIQRAKQIANSSEHAKVVRFCQGRVLQAAFLDMTQFFFYNLCQLKKDANTGYGARPRWVRESFGALDKERM